MIQLVGLAANLTSWGDADAHQTPEGGEYGARCPHCGYIQRVHPWSI